MAKNSKRRGQLVVPFGIGAMVDFKDDTLMTAGMDFWPVETGNKKQHVAEDCRVSDERLEKRLSNMHLRADKKKLIVCISRHKYLTTLKDCHHNPTQLTCLFSGFKIIVLSSKIVEPSPNQSC